MKNLFLIFLALIFFFSNSLNAQVAPSIEWEKCLGGSINDLAYSIQQTSDGGFIVAGYSFSGDGDVSGNHGGYDVWVVKLDSLGAMNWEKYFGGTKDDQAFFVQQTLDDGFIVAGSSKSDDGDVSGHHGSNILRDCGILKLNEEGTLLWQRSLGGSNDDVAFSVQECMNGDFFIAGYSDSNDGDVSGNHGDKDFWIFEIDSSGNLIWQKSLGGDGYDNASSIKQTIDGGLIVAGTSSSNSGDVSGNHGGYDCWILKLDVEGNIQWQKSLGGSNNDDAMSIQQTSDNGFIVAGASESTDGDVTGNHGDDDYWIVKLDTSGNIKWQKSFGGAFEDVASSIQECSNDGFIISGWTYSYDGDVSGNHGGATVSDYWVVRIDTAANLIWQKCLGGSDLDFANSVIQTSEDGFIIAGYTWSFNGDVSGNHGDQDYWIVKLSSDQTGISSQSINSISLSPNPVQNFLTINFAAPINGLAIQVYDLQARLMNLPSSNFESQTSNSIQLNTENLPAGFYMLQIINNKTREREIGKFVKD